MTDLNDMYIKNMLFDDNGTQKKFQFNMIVGC